MTFKKNKYKIIRSAVSKDVVNFVNDYILMKEKVHDTLKSTRYIIPFSRDWGHREDYQCMGAYSHYADIAMETLLINCLPLIEKETNLKLWPTYSFTRVYRKGHKLTAHTDRDECKVSTTLNLGGDMWPIFLTDTHGKDIEVKLKPGDMLLYAGCDLEHWRNPFEGDYCSQVFLHYVEQKSKNKKHRLEDKAHPGLPTWFRGEKI
tara:strand:+ start:2611 stop:3225 length:615 start_codon:yes stop_codon:yes gene_type:complete